MKQVLEKQLREIAKRTEMEYTNMENIGILAGQSGVALLQFYCSKYFDEDHYADTGVEIIANCMDKINKGYAYPTYCAGIAGFGWALQHLCDEHFVALDIDELLEPLDEYLNSQMLLDLGNGNYDFLHGAIGYGFYFLKRYQSTQDQRSKHRYSAILQELVSYLKKMAIHEAETTKWASILAPKKGNKGYNLSLSHGISSIVYFLSRLHAGKIQPKITKQLIHGAVNFILSLENEGSPEISMFPNWVDPNKTLAYNSRLAWCYGDIGIGIALLNAGQTVQNRLLQEKGMAILRRSSKRTAQDNTFVVDAGLCHGSFGNMKIFNRLHEVKPEPDFKNAVEFWLKDGLKRYSGNDMQPYLQWDGLQNTFGLELNLLEGITGIGLGIIDYLSPQKNTWDECLLLR
ncbi:MAG: lanthionine synthetase LanC family protein [Bacteroidota bacterium]